MTNRLIFGVFLVVLGFGYTVVAQSASDAFAAFLKDALDEDPVDVVLTPDELVGEQYVWKSSTGKQWTWNGGPKLNSNGSENGEYWVFDTSQFILQTQRKDLDNVATLTAERQNETAMSGGCISFWYNTKGSIIKSFDMLLVNFLEDIHSQEPFGDANSTITLTTENPVSDIVWSAPENTNGEWMPMAQTFVSPYPYLTAWTTVPRSTTALTRERGYTAIENIQMWSKPCPGECLFIEDTCSWTVESEGNAAWMIGRGTADIISGPNLDYRSSKRMRREAGYVYLDTSYPARPQDSSRMLSMELIPPQIPNVPYCLKFKAMFYGAQNMGFLSVILQTAVEGNDTLFEDKRTLWSYGGKMSSPTFSRTTWANIEVPVVSYEENIKIVIEGTVGLPGRSNIAIDSIRLNQMSCMMIPEIGRPDTGLVLDCSFGVNSCSWFPDGFMRRVRGKGTDDEPFGHTDLSRSMYGGDYYIAAYLQDNKDKPGAVSMLTSVAFEPSSQPMCLSFWYYMFSNAPMYTVVGGIRVVLIEEMGPGSVTKSTTLWSLNNHQGGIWQQAYTSFQSSALTAYLVFEVIKGNERSLFDTLAIDDISTYPRQCTEFPEKASTDILDCDFHKDTCGWGILNPDGYKEERFNWRVATEQNHMPSVGDHTLGLTKVAYLYIDTASQGIFSYLVIHDDSDVVTPNVTEVNCLTFWFRTYNLERDASLSVAWNTPTDATNNVVWKFPKLDEQTQSYDMKDVPWTYGETKIPVVGDIKVLFIAKVRSSGFALDDIKYFRKSDNCRDRPE